MRRSSTNADNIPPHMVGECFRNLEHCSITENDLEDLKTCIRTVNNRGGGIEYL